MKKTITTAVVSALGAAMLIAAPAAEATTTKCNGAFCVHVQGKGLHVDYVQYSYEVPRGKTLRLSFSQYANGGAAKFSTATYKWSVPSYYGKKTKKFSTHRRTVNKSYPNNTRYTSYVYGAPSGMVRPIAPHIDVIIHR